MPQPSSNHPSASLYLGREKESKGEWRELKDREGEVGEKRRRREKIKMIKGAGAKNKEQAERRRRELCVTREECETAAACK